MSRLGLRVIQGSGVKASAWLDLPQLIRAKSWEDPTKMSFFRVAREESVKAARTGRRSPVFEFWSVVHGTPPPVPNVDWHLNLAVKGALTKLEHAHACYRGWNRPCDEDDNGVSAVTYVLKPKVFYGFVLDSLGGMVCPARKRVVANDVVFTVHVRLDIPLEPSVPTCAGVITHWGFVEASPEDPSLPIDFATRYDDRLW